MRESWPAVAWQKVLNRPFKRDPIETANLLYQFFRKVEKASLDHCQITELVFDKLLAFVSPQLLPGTVKAYIHWTGCEGALYQTTLGVQWDSFVIKGRPEEEVRERGDSVECEGKSGNEEEREAHRSLGLVELHPVLHPPPLPPADKRRSNQVPPDHGPTGVFLQPADLGLTEYDPIFFFF